MKKFDVTGMSCAACVARVEKAVNAIDGVTECTVSLLTNSMTVKGEAGSSEIMKAVEKAGYGCSEQKENISSDTVNDDKQIKNLRNRLISSVIVTVVLMYFSMGHMMLDWPVPSFMDSHFILGCIQMILALVVMFINRAFFINGFKTIFHLSPTMDSLVALGSGVSWGYSAVVLFASGEKMSDLYFESAAMILTLITVGKLLEAISKGKTTNALKSLMKLAPKTAVIIQDGKEVTVNVENIKCGNIFILKPGSAIPVDGVVIEGQSNLDESAITGESVPVEKSEDCTVTAGTLNINGVLKCRAVKVGKDTTLSQIIQMVSDAAATKAPVARIADKVAGIFVPCVIAVAVITFCVWMYLGKNVEQSLTYAICVLVVSCPCALGLAVPVAIMVGNGMGAKNGILFKTSAAVESAGKIKIIALDKTGTITSGKMKVVSVYVYDGQSGNFVAVALSSLPLNAPLPSVTAAPGLQSLLQTCATVESQSEHPVARAVVDFCREHFIEPDSSAGFKATGGRGVECIADGSALAGGNLEFIKEKCSPGDELLKLLSRQVDLLAQKGQTPLIFAKDNEILGIAGVADTIKEDSPLAIDLLKKMGIKTVMITGDNELTANTIAAQTKIDSVIAGVLPDQKAGEVKKLMTAGIVAMTGDGINDAPALTVADVGIAIGAGTDVAVDAADVVLVNSSLIDAVNAIKLGRKTLLNIKENLFWAFIYNIALIPVAAGVYSSAGIEMNPMLGAAAMSLSSFCVVMNALRLNLVRLNKRIVKIDDKKLSVNTIRRSEMTKTIRVEGMMCQHCEKHVKESLEKIDGVTSAAANHEKAEVVLELTKDVADADLEKAVTDAGYTFVN